MVFLSAIVYPLFAVFYKSISKAGRLDLGKHGVCVCLNGIRADLHTVIFLRRSRLGGGGRGKTRFYISTEDIHVFAVLWKPVHHIGMVTGDAQFVSLTVADDILLRQSVLLAEIHAKLHGLLVNSKKIRGISQAVLADFKADMGIVRRTPGVPSAMIPRKRLVGSDAPVLQFADESMNADLSAARRRGVPVIAVLIYAQQTVIGTDVITSIKWTT